MARPSFWGNLEKPFWIDWFWVTTVILDILFQRTTVGRFRHIRLRLQRRIVHQRLELPQKCVRRINPAVALLLHSKGIIYKITDVSLSVSNISTCLRFVDRKILSNSPPPRPGQRLRHTVTFNRSTLPICKQLYRPTVQFRLASLSPILSLITCKGSNDFKGSNAVVLFDTLSFSLTIVGTGAASSMTSRATQRLWTTKWSPSATEPITGSSATRGEPDGGRRVTYRYRVESTSAKSSHIPLTLQRPK